MFGYYFNLAMLSLKRNKVLTALMVLAIAVGIGASMTTLTVMHILSGDPLPGRSTHLYYPQVDPTPDNSYYGHHKYPLPMMDDRSAVDLWSAHRADRQALVVDSAVKVRSPDSSLPLMMLGMTSTTADFFPMFGVPFEYGSAWTPADDAGHARVAVISSNLNARLFGGKDSVGKTLRLKDSDVRIVGVLKPWRPIPRFYSVAGGIGANGQGADPYAKPEDVFTPYFTGLEINDGNFQQYTCWGNPPVPGHLENSPCVWVSLWVELGSAAKASAYRDFMANYVQQQKALGRFQQTDTRMLDLMGWLDAEHVIPSDAQLQMWLAFAFLAICLFNTVGLLLAKFLRRGGEIGVRRALGASHRAVFAQCLTEAGLIGFIGGVGGWLLTLVGLWLVRRQQTPYSDLVHMDTAMFTMTIGLAIAVSLLAGTLPALRASRIAPALQLKTL
ncbi:ABC transporter permease [Rhodanobacter glycinis]|uniref:Putative ABC transport system permease protein n=1 Tax=Rhodanobacter glycinis TaxID=582702 RepID=A0A1I4A8K6_9GAMM|nr:ABC transporter permease [Rhodanobacter glycinis]SFK52417.1 putative ABC transport system permease protein [Rhodanobacter glycinis]